MSQNQQALQRFKRNRWGVFSALYIGLMLALALFAYVLSPDKTRNANQMNLTIHSKSPGFSVAMLSLPEPATNQVSSWEVLTQGNPNAQVTFPLESYEIVNQQLQIVTYADHPSLQEKRLFSLADFPGFSSWDQVIASQIKDKTFWLGTDKYGRDLLSRMLIGSRVSMSIGLVAVFISLVVGIFFGLLGGYYGGKVDAAVMWLVNIIWSIPTLLLVIAITLALGKGFWQVFVAVGLTMWVEVTRVVRGQVLSLREQQYVTAARALGFNDARIMLGHILPNITAPIIVISAANFASAILVESGLSFLGLGAQPPIPSWGGIIKDHYHYLLFGKPYLAMVPGIAISLITLAFMIMGNALRDALDVKHGSV